LNLLLATNNRGKLAEFRRLLAPIPLTIPEQLGLYLTVVEDGETFAANAALKAQAFAEASGLIALADDSGLEVDALDGAPGVHSARYGGEHLDDAGRCRLLLHALHPRPRRQERSARFRCCLTAVAVDGRSCTAQGCCEGFIADAAVGEGGFGYDPVFYLADYGCTIAELKPADKDAVSHRAQALKALLPALRKTFPELGE
jgi:XTP/dITP diphosphohydrolase